MRVNASIDKSPWSILQKKRGIKKEGIKNSKRFIYHFSNIRYVFYSIAILVILFLTATNLMHYHFNKDILGVRTDLLQEEDYWADVVNQNPSYLDGWLKLAIIQMQLGEKSKAVESIAKAQSVDPRSEKIRKVKEELRLY